MEYRRFEDTLVVRIDRGEEILEQLTAVAEAEQVALAEVSGLGALGEFTTGVFHVTEQRYESTIRQGEFEIVSLTGTITRQEGKPYLHLHLSAGDGEGRVYGGHLNRGVVSATCEVVLRLIPGQVGRRFDPGVGLNLFEFQ